MSSSRVESLRVDTTRHLEKSSRQSESLHKSALSCCGGGV